MEWEQYISGFFDGDGSICVEKIKGGGYTLRIKLFQSNEKLIDVIQGRYVFLHKGIQKRKDRPEYSLRASGAQIQPLLNELRDCTILKYEQILKAQDFLTLGRKMHDAKERIYEDLKCLKKGSSNKPYDRLCTTYIAGLFDAEGSIGLYSSGLRTKLTQKSDRKILEEIGKLYNNTNVINNYALCFYDGNCTKFLEDMKKYCIYKLPQINMALDYLSNNVSFEVASKTLKELKRV